MEEDKECKEKNLRVVNFFFFLAREVKFFSYRFIGRRSVYTVHHVFGYPDSPRNKSVEHGLGITPRSHSVLSLAYRGAGVDTSNVKSPYETLR